MKFLFLSLITYFAFGNSSLYTRLVFQDSKLCLRSNSQTKCASDSLTTQQQTEIQNKINSLSSKVPDYILNDVLNHFWANNYQFTSNQISQLLLNMNSVECNNQNGIFHKRKPEIIAQINKWTEQQRQNERSLVAACIDEELSQKVYRSFDFNAIEESLQNQSNQ